MGVTQIFTEFGRAIDAKATHPAEHFMLPCMVADFTFSRH